MRILRPVPVDFERFAPGRAPSEARYGLPTDIRFCRSCVISNQRPNSAVEFEHTRESRKTTIRMDEGVCDACRVAEEKRNVDWEARRAALRALCDRHRRSDGHYDCLVPGSGGKDSFYASHILKHEFGMHPLTVTWAPHIYTDWGWRNFQRWIHAGFDNILVTPSGRVHRLLTRLSVDVLFHPFQPFIIGQKALAPRYSILYDIPLVFYGENEAEYGNPRSDSEQAQRDWSYFTASDETHIHIAGVALKDLKETFGLDDTDFLPYLPPSPDELKRVGTEVHYLGYYLRWHPQSCYYYAQEHGGFEPSPERTPGTYSKYNSIDDRVDDFHYYTTFVKFGIGRATSDAAQEIRSADIERDEGVALVRRYDGEFPERFVDQLLDYLSMKPEEFPKAHQAFESPIMDRAYFNMLADSFRSPHLWKWENGAWALRKAVWHDDA
jgi:N-acetyl sugar amidotransferase